MTREQTKRHAQYRLLVLVCLLVIAAHWGLRRFIEKTEPVFDEVAFESVLAALDSSDTPLTMDQLETQLLGLGGWDRVVLCAPYRVTDEFTAAGIRDDSLAKELADISNWVEDWHVIAIDENGTILGDGILSACRRMKPAISVIVLEAKGKNEGKSVP